VTTRREQTSGESRDLILAAAADLFASKGYRQTTFADVAERSGISRGSIPWHFGSKEGLLLAVLERSVQQLIADLDPGPLPDAATELERMARGLEALFSRPNARLFVTLLVEAMEPDSPIHDRYAAMHEALRANGRRALEELLPSYGKSLDALVAAIVGAAIGIHQQWLINPAQVDLGQSLDALRDMVLNTVRA
jgi:TetR/AcrR family transcriptional regulator, acrAB operon repressor